MVAAMVSAAIDAFEASRRFNRRRLVRLRLTWKRLRTLLKSDESQFLIRIVVVPDSALDMCLRKANGIVIEFVDGSKT